MSGHAHIRIDGKTAIDEIAGCGSDVPPVLGRGEGVVSDEDGLHLLKIRFPIEWRIAAKEEVGNDADGPNISTVNFSSGCILVRGERRFAHTGFPCPDFLNISGAM